MMNAAGAPGVREVLSTFPGVPFGEAKFKSFVHAWIRIGRKNTNETDSSGDKSRGVLSNFVRIRRIVSGSWCLVTKTEFNHNGTRDTTMENRDMAARRATGGNYGRFE